jgi:hypothetical protein
LFSAKHYATKIIYTIMLLDMGLAPIAWQLWKKGWCVAGVFK